MMAVLALSCAEEEEQEYLQKPCVDVLCDLISRRKAQVGCRAGVIGNLGRYDLTSLQGLGTRGRSGDIVVKMAAEWLPVSTEDIKQCAPSLVILETFCCIDTPGTTTRLLFA